MNAPVSRLAAGPCSTSGRCHVGPVHGTRSVREAVLAPHMSAQRTHTSKVHAVVCASAAKDSAALEVADDDAAKYNAIALAMEARLRKLYSDAPDDAELADFTNEAMQWDENELLKEGELLALEDMMNDTGDIDNLEDDDASVKPKKEKMKPAPIDDPNALRKKQGRRLIISEVPMEQLPKVAVVGRPNVGKSALFNRIVGKTAAIVYDTPGVTRDRLYMRAVWGDREFVLIDTGGLMSSASKLPDVIRENAIAEISEADLPFAIERQAAAGIEEADVIVMTCDGQTGPTAADEEVIDWLRKCHSKKKVLLAVNKCESATQGETQAAQFWGYGLEPIAVSAISGTGTGDLMERLAEALPPMGTLEKREREVPFAVAIVGRPNVGKSSMVNAITGSNRAIVSNMSGTTRDAVDTEVILPDGTPMRLVDTAGIRRRAKVASSADGAEPMSVVRAIRAIRRTDVVVMMLDATAGVTAQDYKIAELAAAEGRAVVLVINKWDAVPNKTQDSMKEAELDAKEQLRPVTWAKCVFTSATKGKNIAKVLKAALEADEIHRKRVPTATLNMVVNEAVAWKGPPSIRGTNKKPRIYYATQAAIRPPTFIFFCNDGRLIGDDYKRYLERSLRENIDLEGTPIRIYFRGKAASTDQRSATA